MARSSESVFGSKSKLVEFYSYKNVFITGGAGFMGKCLVETLLRKVPDIGKIYLLLREKKGMSAAQQLEEVLKNSIFDTIKKQNSDFRRKLIPVNGNIKYDKFGIKDEVYQMMIDEVNIILHNAAAVKFNDKLSHIASVNVKGTHEIILFSEKVKNLDVVMVTSTLYGFIARSFVKEVFFPSPMSPSLMLQLLSEQKHPFIDRIAKTLRGDIPNNYIYTKAIMEEIVRDNVGKLPIGLYRPPVVLSGYESPLDGWLDTWHASINGNIGVSSGLIHTFLSKQEFRAEIVPVDYCINNYLACVYDVYEKSNSDDVDEQFKPVYNYKQSGPPPFTQSELAFNPEIEKYPYSKIQVWAQSFHLTRCIFIFIVMSIFTQFLPALIFDGFLIAKGHPPMLTKKIKRLFVLNMKTRNAFKEFVFTNDNVQRVISELDDVDKKLFAQDLNEIDWQKWRKMYHLGIRTHMLKESMDEESLRKCREKYRKLQIAHYIVKFTFIGICSFLIGRCILNFLF